MGLKNKDPKVRIGNGLRFSDLILELFLSSFRSLNAEQDYNIFQDLQFSGKLMFYIRNEKQRKLWLSILQIPSLQYKGLIFI
jgi:hypothetical protein